MCTFSPFSRISLVMAPTTRSNGAAERQVVVETECEGETPRKRRRGNDLEDRTCSICGRVFTKAIHKRNHMNVHVANRQKYSCPNCDKKYNDVKNWRVHYMKSHTRGRDSAKGNQLAKAEQKLKLGPANPPTKTVLEKMEELEYENRELRLKVMRRNSFLLFIDVENMYN